MSDIWPNAWNDKDDAALMAAIQAGQVVAFEVLVRRHTSRFYALAYRYLQNRAGAEDLLQDAFVKLWADPGKWDAARGVRFTTWFSRIVIHLALDQLRRRRVVPLPEADLLVDGALAADMRLIEQDRNVALARAMSALPERQKTALHLCYGEDLRSGEAAEIMGIGVKALESLLMRGKAALRVRLAPAGEKGGENGYR